MELTEKEEKIPVIALVGNPNVGKSTLFNLLTGSKQHTGNWPGKTVEVATGTMTYKGEKYSLTDLPGTYSLTAHSAEEEVARDFICFKNPDAAVVVCDATALERNLNLALQCLEISKRTLICVNLTDEAEKKGITLNLKGLSKFLKVPVVGISARSKIGIEKFQIELINLLKKDVSSDNFFSVPYPKAVEQAAEILLSENLIRGVENINPKWAALKVLEGDIDLSKKIQEMCGKPLFSSSSVTEGEAYLMKENIDKTNLSDIITKSTVLYAEEAANMFVGLKKENYAESDRKKDLILTGKFTGIPIMILMLTVIFWITVYLANIPSELLSQMFSFFEKKILLFLTFINFPQNATNLLVFGVYRVLSWVISVMLPPMAIFFPLFSFLEDLGYLPRIAFMLDGAFKKCGACGKQALTMCMGFGCNAVGVSGCRIIDSPRERLLAVLTNSFVPCNGRFPMMISIISAFFITKTSPRTDSAYKAVILMIFVCIGVFSTFIVSFILSKILLKGTPSSFTLELPPYRKPEISKIIIRSFFDRIRFVFIRAVKVAAPAGAFIWLAANCTFSDNSLLGIISNFLNPFAEILGLDGAILLAFILGLPANEIVIPLLIMIYTSSGVITEISSIEALREILLSMGWSIKTAVNMLILTVMHWPCSTTLLTVKKETQSIKTTLLAFIIPTLSGFLLCFISNLIFALISKI